MRTRFGRALPGSLVILALGFQGCSKSEETDSSTTTTAPPITTPEAAKLAVPTATQLALSLNLNPAGFALEEGDDDECAAWGNGIFAAPCSIGTTVEMLSEIVSTFIAEAGQSEPTETDGGWEFITTIDRASASEEALATLMNTTCADDDTLGVENDTIVLRLFMKQLADGSVDLDLGAGASEDAIVDGIITGNWLQADGANEKGRGAITLSFAKSAELDIALFAAAGSDYETVCGSAPESAGSLTLSADNTVTPATASLELSDDFMEGSIAGQTFSFTFHGDSETEFEMAFLQNMVGSADDFEIFNDVGTEDENVTFHIGIRHTANEFAVTGIISAEEGDRAGKDPLTMRSCGKYDGASLVEGFRSIDSPSDLKDFVDAAVLADPENEDLQAYSAENEAEYCPTFESIEM